MLDTIVSIETFMGDFGIVPMKTAKDEGLMSVETCKTRVLDLINMNIQNFKNNAWNADNRMNKLLIDLDPKKNKSVFTVRLGGKRIYRCNTVMLSLPQKIEFLTKFYEAVSKGCLNQQIVDFCEAEAKLAEYRKQKQKERRKAKRKAEREALKEKEAEAAKHLPHAV